MNCPHSAIPLSPAHSSGAHSTPNLPGMHPHAHLHPHHAHSHSPHGHSHMQPQQSQQGVPAAENGHLHAVHALEAPHPHIPDAHAHPAGGPAMASSAGPATPGTLTPGARAHFVETLGSKKSWDALVHGAWM